MSLFVADLLAVMYAPLWVAYFAAILAMATAVVFVIEKSTSSSVG